MARNGKGVVRVVRGGCGRCGVVCEVGDLVVLDDRAGGEDGLRVAGVVRERVAQEVERLVVLSQPQVEQPHGGQQLGVLRRKLERL